jgi:hypothetical protein
MFEPKTNDDLRQVLRWFKKHFPMPGWKITLSFTTDKKLATLTERDPDDYHVLFGCAHWSALERRAWAYIAPAEMHEENKESTLETAFHELGHIYWEGEESVAPSTTDHERKLNTWARVLAQFYQADLEKNHG